MQTPTDTLLACYACELQIRRFVQLNDLGAYEELVQLFTPDGTFSRPSTPDQVVRGRAAILSAFQSRPKRNSRHITANVLVELTSDVTARASSQLLLFTSTASEVPARAASPVWVGSYHDVLELHNGRWLFSQRSGALEFEVALG